MNSYTLTDKLRKARRRYPLTATEQALYYELVAICNEVDWEDTFSCSNDELCAALNISENTLNASRLSLIQKGLIYYKSGKSRRIHGIYSFIKPLTTSKSEDVSAVATEGATEVDTGVDAEVVAEVDASDIYKEQTKPNQTKPKKGHEKKIKYRHNIQLTPTEHQKLVSEHGENFVVAVYDYFSSYKIEKNYSTKSDYLTILRWVLEAVRKDQEKKGGNVVQMPIKSTYDPYDRKHYYTDEDYEKALKKLPAKNVS